jgi:hypothetical protein
MCFYIFPGKKITTEIRPCIGRQIKVIEIQKILFSSGHANVVGLLIKYHANIELKDKKGWSPLHEAAFNGNRLL